MNNDEWSGNALFGYVVIDKPELKVSEYEAFQGYYCGLCKALKKSFSYKSRFLLSYDCVFLYVLYSSLKNDKPDIKRQRCPIHPVEKRFVIDTDGAEFAASMNILLSYRKFMDDAQDDSSAKAKTAALMFKREYKSCREKYPEIAGRIEKSIDELNALETENSSDIDRTADVFASMLGYIVSTIDREDELSLYDLGYAIGRWLYLIDAYDDMDDDRLKGRYNVFLSKFGDNMEEAKASAEFNLYSAANSAGMALNRLDLKRNLGILRNIILSGLPKTTKKILLGGNNGSI